MVNIIGILIYSAYVGLVTALVLYYAYLRIKEAKQIATSKIVESSSFYKQQFVKNNRAVFGINDKELDDEKKEIYTVSPEKLGL